MPVAQTPRPNDGAPRRPAQSDAPRPQQRRDNTPASPRKSGGISKGQKITLIVLAVIAVLLIIGIVVTAFFIWGEDTDDGRIFSNVFAAGVNLGGMTEEEARQALHAATDETFTKLNMTVQVLDTTVSLSPSDTGARLDVDAVVEAALSYGRDGSKVNKQQSLLSSHTISILPYLNLDTDYIRSMVDALGAQYSSTLSQGSFRLEGTAPSLQQDSYDTSVPYQTLYISIGTAEYGLNTDTLYEKILDAYDINLFEVVGECSVVAPDPLDLDGFHAEHYIQPVDATMDSATYEVTPEVYGYGFDLEAAKARLAEAKYGDVIEVTLHFIEPDITAELLAGDLFRDVLASFRTKVSGDKNLTANLTLACQAINGTLLKSGEDFSFNEIVGKPTVGKGYKEVEMYQDKELTEVLGGGLSQAASTLYCSAILADLKILDRTAHDYAPDFTDVGLDAYVEWGAVDFAFRNTTDNPIRIEAQLIGGYLQINLIGTDDRAYYVQMETDTVQVMKPTTLVQTMYENNSGKYQDGDVLMEGITGYDVVIYRCRYEKETRQLSEKVWESSTRYDKRNEIVIEIVEPEPIPTEPSEPETEPTEPVTEPSEPATTPTEPPATEATQAATEPPATEATQNAATSTEPAVSTASNENE